MQKLKNRGYGNLEKGCEFAKNNPANILPKITEKAKVANVF
jgi:hypothetical protein